MTRAGSRTLVSSIAILVAIGLIAAGCDRERRQTVDLYGPNFCYRTLAEVDCHEAALPGEEGRLVGHYEAPKGRAKMEPRF